MKINNLTKSFDKKLVFKDFSIEIPENKVISIIYVFFRFSKGKQLFCRKNREKPAGNNFFFPYDGDYVRILSNGTEAPSARKGEHE